MPQRQPYYSDEFSIREKKYSKNSLFPFKSGRRSPFLILAVVVRSRAHVEKVASVESLNVPSHFQNLKLLATESLQGGVGQCSSMGEGSPRQLCGQLGRVMSLQGVLLIEVVWRRNDGECYVWKWCCIGNTHANRLGIVGIRHGTSPLQNAIMACSEPSIKFLH